MISSMAFSLAESEHAIRGCYYSRNRFTLLDKTSQIHREGPLGSDHLARPHDAAQAHGRARSQDVAKRPNGNQLYPDLPRLTQSGENGKLSISINIFPRKPSCCPTNHQGMNEKTLQCFSPCCRPQNPWPLTVARSYGYPALSNMLLYLYISEQRKTESNKL